MSVRATTLLLFCVVLAAAGCSPKTREERRPAPSSAMTHEQGVAWARRHWDNASMGRISRPVLPTGSMAPVFDSRSVLLTEPANDVRVGDIVIYGDRLTTHRVRELQDGYALIDGDGLKESDGWIALSRVRERVAGIIYTKG